ncbi:MAG: hypothetical protein AMK75_02645 [Planctomycetes bacterium SM23_65]|nr:MAG: hypothetical protein AMK75_02645 [Planctomycetes bacterium SM23_65]
MIMVDELRRYRSGSWCHLTTDGDIEELHVFAQRIGLKREWFQNVRVPHYDLRPSLRRKALAAGARFVSAREQARARVAQRSAID